MTAVLKPQRSARTMPLRELTAATAAPIAVVRANLMPPMVADKRRLTWLRRRLIVALVLLVALVGAGYAYVTQETSSSQDELATAQQETARLNAQVAKFDGLLKLQAQATALRTQLATVMTTDLQWTTLINSLDTAAVAARVAVAQIAGKVDDAAAATGAAATPDASAQLPLPNGTTVVGTLELSGVGKDYRAVATFVEKLAAVRGFTRVEPGSVTTDGRAAAYTIKLSLTSDVFGGRFTRKAGK